MRGGHNACGVVEEKDDNVEADMASLPLEVDDDAADDVADKDDDDSTVSDK